MLSKRIVRLSWLCIAVLTFSLLFALWFKAKLFFVSAAVALGVYFFLSFRFLRCPNCGTGLRLADIPMGAGKTYFCFRCGHQIQVE